MGEEMEWGAGGEGATVATGPNAAATRAKLQGTISTAAAEVEGAGGKALPLLVDVRDEARVASAVDEAAAHFGGLDVLVNNASAINLTGTLATPMKRFDLMWSVNARATFACSQAAIPHLRKAANPHILTLSPPLDLAPKWFAP